MVEQDLLELLGDGQQVLECLGGHLGERVISRREDGERTGTLECLDEARLVAAWSRVLNEPAAVAVATMSLSAAGLVVGATVVVGARSGGRSTSSMTWMTPFDAAISVVTTLVVSLR